MSSEARCYQCDKLLGATDSEVRCIVFPMAVQATENQLLFTIKCPRCGKHNYIKFTK